LIPFGLLLLVAVSVAVFEPERAGKGKPPIDPMAGPAARVPSLLTLGGVLVRGAAMAGRLARRGFAVIRSLGGRRGEAPGDDG